jgi:hypothetical protein
MQNDANIQPAEPSQPAPGSRGGPRLPDHLPRDKSFKTLVTNLSGDIELIKQLRELANEAISPGQQQEVDEVLTKVVAMSTETYGTVRAYISDDTGPERTANRDSAEKIIADLKTQIEFEEAWGPCLRELSEPMAALNGYVDLLSSLSGENRELCLARFDQALDLVSDILTAYKNRFQGTPGLHRHIDSY